ncbi:MAG TPA: adenylate/guanylate cyclase domain-containing protein [Dongiaceae bacterium]|nr:adenylate/guanylate cyclase domain-containing protein [Dongiaceae bacterium]
MEHPDILDKLALWLAQHVPGHASLEDLFPAFSREIARRGLPVWRSQLGLEVLHPEASGWMLIWQDETLAVHDRKRQEVLGQHLYLNSPTWVVDETGRAFRKRLDDGPQAMELLEELRAQGATDYVMFPLPFLDRQRTAVVSFATRQAGGFGDNEIAALQAAAELFSPYAERQVLRRITVDLLDTYIGHRSGRRISDGQIELGQIDYIEAAIWLADLRGFTRYSEEAPIAEVIGALNAWLGPMVKLIEHHGGEVLKFIGDAVLASFPAADHGDRRSACRQALAAAEAFCAAIDALNAERMTAGQRRLDFGLGLHVGEVAYGNIGAATRLDFTVIGPAVNRAARLQELTKKLGERVLISADFAAHAALDLRDLGLNSLRDVGGVQHIFAPPTLSSPRDQQA